MASNPLHGLADLGQSIWLDFLSRGLLRTGQLQRLIREDGLSGVTANPSIFEKAILDSHDYDAAIEDLAHRGQKPIAIYEALAVEDVGNAADLFLPVHSAKGGLDGFVSLEVSPRLADDTEGTLQEARRFSRLLNRRNVMIKVPATRAGLPAIRRLTAEGTNVNVTLLFGLPRYREVVDAYIGGLEDRAAQGLPVDQIASVASFFLSRIDVLLDPQLDAIVKHGNAKGHVAGRLRGQAAIASAKIAYEMYGELFGSPRFKALAGRGAHPQRLLWASTGTKDPAYSDVKYVDALIGPDTVNTMPMETLQAYRDHGHPALRLREGVPEAHQVLLQLAGLGIDLDQVTAQLEHEGVQKFNDALDKLLGALQQKVGSTEAAR